MKEEEEEEEGISQVSKWGLNLKGRFSFLLCGTISGCEKEIKKEIVGKEEEEEEENFNFFFLRRFPESAEQGFLLG